METVDTRNAYQQDLLNAQIVQRGLLPKARHFDRLFNNWFVYFMPQNVISGDFYWVGHRHNLRYLVVGDCTGHGISASLLSVLALNLFEYVIMNKGLKNTNDILREVDKRFIESFKNAGSDTFDNPWVDLSIVAIDQSNQMMQFSSANRKMLFINHQHDVSLHTGSRYPIGGWQIKKDRQFVSQMIPFEPGDTLYLGSDGFQDQSGGPKGKKYKSKRLHEFLRTNAHLPMQVQKSMLQTELDAWKGVHPQTDDICLVGVRL